MRKSPEKAAVLIVHYEPDVRDTLAVVLEGSYEVHQAITGKAALEIVLNNTVDLVLLDILLPDVDGVSFIGKLKRTDPHLKIVALTSVSKVRTAVEAMKSGAYDYLGKPLPAEEVLKVVGRALEKPGIARAAACMNKRPVNDKCFEEMIGRDEKIRQIFQFISKVADSHGPVLIQGESGTGKELVARAIHNRSHRFDRPLKIVNCAAVPHTLMERELFGHNRGAFTNAVQTLPGKLEAADGGTVFLDDIDTLDINTQAKLLRVIQHKEFERLGGNKVIRADIRFVAACNRDLKHLIREGRFREDLFFRLNVFPIELPPLRHRRGDIPLLLDHFLELHRGNGQRASVAFSKEAMDKILRHQWPGNIRELENLVLHVSTITRKSVIHAQDLPFLDAPDPGTCIKPLKEAVESFERDYIRDVLKQVNGSRRLAAQHLDIHRNTLQGKISRLGV